MSWNSRAGMIRVNPGAGAALGSVLAGSFAGGTSESAPSVVASLPASFHPHTVGWRGRIVWACVGRRCGIRLCRIRWSVVVGRLASATVDGFAASAAGWASPVGLPLVPQIPGSRLWPSWHLSDPGGDVDAHCCWSCRRSVGAGGPAGVGASGCSVAGTSATDGGGVLKRDANEADQRAGPVQCRRWRPRRAAATASPDGTSRASQTRIGRHGLIRNRRRGLRGWACRLGRVRNSGPTRCLDRNGFHRRHVVLPELERSRRPLPSCGSVLPGGRL